MYIYLNLFNYLWIQVGSIYRNVWSKVCYEMGFDRTWQHVAEWKRGIFAVGKHDQGLHSSRLGLGSGAECMAGCCCLLPKDPVPSCWVSASAAHFCFLALLAGPGSVVFSFLPSSLFRVRKEPQSMNFSMTLTGAVLYISSYLWLVIEGLSIGLGVLRSIFMNLNLNANTRLLEQSRLLLTYINNYSGFPWLQLLPGVMWWEPVSHVWGQGALKDASGHLRNKPIFTCCAGTFVRQSYHLLLMTVISLSLQFSLKKSLPCCLGWQIMCSVEKYSWQHPSLFTNFTGNISNVLSFVYDAWISGIYPSSR